MLRLKNTSPVASPQVSDSLGPWGRFVSAAGTVALLATGCLYLAPLSQQLGLFPTLFMGGVVAVCLAMQLAELCDVHLPQA